jgi:hypothetical protein
MSVQQVYQSTKSTNQTFLRKKKEREKKTFLAARVSSKDGSRKKERDRGRRRWQRLLDQRGPRPREAMSRVGPASLAPLKSTRPEISLLTPISNPGLPTENLFYIIGVFGSLDLSCYLFISWDDKRIKSMQERGAGYKGRAAEEEFERGIGGAWAQALFFQG